jgi:hypothetical protein
LLAGAEYEKKTIITCGIMILFSGVLLIFCGQRSRFTKLPFFFQTDSQPVHKHEPDSASAYEAFKELILLKVSDNEKALLRLHAEIGNSSKQVKAKYFSVLLNLRHRNYALKTSVAGYREYDQNNRVVFERTLLSDMDQLDHSIMNFWLPKEIMI